jgi:hypothetical protein
MSNVQLEATQSTCQFDIALTGGNVALGSLGFMEQVLKMQADASFDELGDCLLAGNDEVQRAQEQAGTSLEADTAASLFRAVSTCLQQRYLGNCAVSGNCTGRDFVDKELATLGISRYKDEM